MQDSNTVFQVKSETIVYFVSDYDRSRQTLQITPCWSRVNRFKDQTNPKTSIPNQSFCELWCYNRGEQSIELLVFKRILFLFSKDDMVSVLSDSIVPVRVNKGANKSQQIHWFECIYRDVFVKCCTTLISAVPSTIHWINVKCQKKMQNQVIQKMCAS